MISLKNWWSWNGRRFAPPRTILRRLLTYPVIVLLRALLALAVAVGWGWEAGVDNWHTTE